MPALLMSNLDSLKSGLVENSLVEKSDPGAFSKMDGSLNSRKNIC